MHPGPSTPRRAASPAFEHDSNNCSLGRRTGWIKGGRLRHAVKVIKRGQALTLVAAAAAIGASAPAGAQESAGAADLTPTGRGAYVSIAGAVDTYAIRAGDLAVENARDPQIEALGRSFAADHRGHSDRTLAAARTLGMDAPEPAMLPMHWDMLRRLERASESRFDRVFLRQQLRAHEMALALHRNYATNGDAPVLREVAASVLPQVERHLAQLRALDD
jgi:putative membrane protein